MEGTVRIASPTGDFAVTVEGLSVAEVSPEESYVYASWNIGTDVQMECLVYHDQLDIAATLVSVAENLLTNSEATLGKLQEMSVAHLDAGVWDHVPYLRLDYLYTTRLNGAPQAGLLKQVIATRDQRTIYCLHNELGYRDTFMRLASRFITELQLARPAPRPLYVSVDVITLNERRFGVSEYTIRRESDGFRTSHWRSTLVPQGNGQVSARDRYRLELTDGGGRLRSAVEVESQNSELVTDLSLDPTPEGSWSVTGVHEGQRVSASFHAGRLPSDIEYHHMKANFLRTSKVGDVWSVNTWSTGADPTQVTAFTLTVLDDQPSGVVAQEEQAGQIMRSQLNRDGEILRSVIQLGANRVVSVRVYSAGAYPGAEGVRAAKVLGGSL